MASGWQNKIPILKAVQDLKDESERVQKKTFTKWINSYFIPIDESLQVENIFEDLKDGLKLLALLEILGAEKLPKDKRQVMQRVHCLSNVQTALKFLEMKKVPLVNIHATDIVDGKRSIILGLIWHIIIYFQIENQNILGNKKPNARKALLDWVSGSIAEKYGMKIADFGSSWRNGHAFNAMVHNINPELVDMDRVKTNSNPVNLNNAFNVAESELGIPKILDAEDVDVEKPDEKSIMTYVAQFLKSYPEGRKSLIEKQSNGDDSDFTASKSSVQKSALESTEEAKEKEKFNEINQYIIETTAKMPTDSKSPIKNPKKDFQDLANVLVNKGLKQVMLDDLCTRRDTNTLVRVHPNKIDRLENGWSIMLDNINEWKWRLDKLMPGKLGSVIGPWLAEAEKCLEQDWPSEEEINDGSAATNLKDRLEQHEEIFDRQDEIEGEFKKLKKEYETLAKMGKAGPDAEMLKDQLFLIEKRLMDLREKESPIRNKLQYEVAKDELNELIDTCEQKLKNEWKEPFGEKKELISSANLFEIMINDLNLMKTLPSQFDEFKEFAEIYKNQKSIPSEKENIQNTVDEIELKIAPLLDQLKNSGTLLDRMAKSWKATDKECSNIENFIGEVEKTIPDENVSLDDKKTLAGKVDEKSSEMDDIYKHVDFIEDHSREEVGAKLRKNVDLLKAKLKTTLEKLNDEIKLQEDKKQAEEDEFVAMETEKFQSSQVNIEDWLDETEDLLSRSKKSEPYPETIEDFISQLQTCEEDLPEKEEDLKEMEEHANSLAKFRSQNNQLSDDFKKNSIRLNALKNNIPKEISRLRKCLAPAEQVKANTEEIHDWIDQCKKLMNEISKETDPLKLEKLKAELAALMKQKPDIAEKIGQAKNSLAKIKSDGENGFDLKPFAKELEELQRDLSSISQTVENQQKAETAFNATADDINDLTDKLRKALEDLNGTDGTEEEQRRKLEKLKGLKSKIPNAEKLIEDAIRTAQRNKDHCSPAEQRAMEKKIEELKNNLNKFKDELNEAENKISSDLNERKVIGAKSKKFEEDLAHVIQDLQAENTRELNNLSDKEDNLQSNKDFVKQLKGKRREIEELTNQAKLIQEETGDDTELKRISALSRKLEDAIESAEKAQDESAKIVADEMNYRNVLANYRKHVADEIDPIKKRLLELSDDSKEELAEKKMLLEKLAILEREQGEKLKDELRNLGHLVSDESGKIEKKEIEKELAKLNKGENINGMDLDLANIAGKIAELEEKLKQMEEFENDADDFEMELAQLVAELNEETGTDNDKNAAVKNSMYSDGTVEEKTEHLEKLNELQKKLADSLKAIGEKKNSRKLPKNLKERFDAAANQINSEKQKNDFNMKDLKVRIDGHIEFNQIREKLQNGKKKIRHEIDIKELNSVQGENADLERRKRDLANAEINLSGIDQKIKQLKKVAQSECNRKTTTEKQREIMDEDVKNCENELDALKNTIDRARNQLDSELKIRNELDAKMEDNRKQFSILQTRMNEEAKKRGNSYDEKTELVNSCQDLVDSMTDQKANLENLVKQAEVLKTEKDAPNKLKTANQIKADFEKTIGFAKNLTNTKQQHVDAETSMADAITAYKIWENEMAQIKKESDDAVLSDDESDELDINDMSTISRAQEAHLTRSKLLSSLLKNQPTGEKLLRDVKDAVDKVAQDSGNVEKEKLRQILPNLRKGFDQIYEHGQLKNELETSKALANQLAEMELEQQDMDDFLEATIVEHEEAQMLPDDSVDEKMEKQRKENQVQRKLMDRSKGLDGLKDKILTTLGRPDNSKVKGSRALEKAVGDLMNKHKKLADASSNELNKLNDKIMSQKECENLINSMNEWLATNEQELNEVKERWDPSRNTLLRPIKDDFRKVNGNLINKQLPTGKSILSKISGMKSNPNLPSSKMVPIIKKLEDQMEDHEISLDETKKKLDNEMRIRNGIENSIENSNKKLDKLSEQIEQTNKRPRNSLEEKQQLLQANRDYLATLKSQKEGLENDAHNLCDELENLTGVDEEFRSSIENLESRYTSKIDSIEKAITQGINQIERELDLGQANAEFENLINDINQYLESMKTDQLSNVELNNNLNDMSEFQSEKIPQLENSFNELEKISDQVRAESGSTEQNKIRNDLANAAGDLQNCKEKIEDLNHELKTKMGKMADFDNELDTFEQFLIEQENEYDAINRQIGEVSYQQWPDMIQQLNTIQGRLSARKRIFSQIEDKARANNLLQNEVIRTKLCELRNRLNDDEHGVIGRMNELKSGWEGVSGLEQKLNRMELWLNQKKSQLEQCSSNLDEKNRIESNLHQIKDIQWEKLDGKSIYDFVSCEIDNHQLPDNDWYELLNRADQKFWTDRLERTGDEYHQFQSDLAEIIQRLNAIIEQLKLFGEDYRRQEKVCKQLTEKLENAQDMRGNNQLEKERLLDEAKAIVSNSTQCEDDLSKLASDINAANEQYGISKGGRIQREVDVLEKQIQKLCKSSQDHLKQLENFVHEHQQFNAKLASFSSYLDEVENKRDSLVKQIQQTQTSQNSHHLITYCNQIQALINEDCRDRGESELKELIATGEQAAKSTGKPGRSEINRELIHQTQRLDQLAEEISDLKLQFENMAGDMETYENDMNRINQNLTETEQEMNRISSIHPTGLEEKQKKVLDMKTIEAKVNAYSKPIEAIQQKIEDYDKNSELPQKLLKLRERHKLLQEKVKKECFDANDFLQKHMDYEKRMERFKNWLKDTNEKVENCKDRRGTKEAVMAKLKALNTLKSRIPEADSIIEDSIQASHMASENSTPEEREQITGEIEILKVNKAALMTQVSSVDREINQSLNLWTNLENDEEKIDKKLQEVTEKLQSIRNQIPSSLEEQEALSKQCSVLQEDLANLDKELDQFSANASKLSKISDDYGPIRTTKALQNRYKKLNDDVNRVHKQIDNSLKKLRDFEAAADEFYNWMRPLVELKESNDDDVGFPQRNNADQEKTPEQVQQELQKKQQLLKNLLNSKPQGEKLLEIEEKLGQEALLDLSPNGQMTIKEKMSKLKKTFNELFGGASDGQANDLEMANKLIEKIANSSNGLKQDLKNIDSELDEIRLTSNVNSKLEKLNDLRKLKDRLNDKANELEKLQQDVNKLARISPNSERPLENELNSLRAEHSRLEAEIERKNRELDESAKNQKAFNTGAEDLTEQIKKLADSLKAHCDPRGIAGETGLAEKLSKIRKIKTDKIPQLQRDFEELENYDSFQLTPEEDQDRQRKLASLSQALDELNQEANSAEKFIHDGMITWQNFDEKAAELNALLKSCEEELRESEGKFPNDLEGKMDKLAKDESITNKLQRIDNAIQDLMSEANKLAEQTENNEPVRKAEALSQFIGNVKQQLADQIKRDEDDIRIHREYDELCKKCDDWLDEQQQKKDEARMDMNGNDDSGQNEQAINNRLTALQQLVAKRPEGERLLHELMKSGERVGKTTSPAGRERIKNDLNDRNRRLNELYQNALAKQTELTNNVQRLQTAKLDVKDCIQFLNRCEKQLEEILNQNELMPRNTPGVVPNEFDYLLKQTEHRLSRLEQLNSTMHQYDPQLKTVIRAINDLLERLPDNNELKKNKQEINEKSERIKTLLTENLELDRTRLEKLRKIVNLLTKFEAWLSKIEREFKDIHENNEKKSSSVSEDISIEKTQIMEKVNHLKTINTDIANHKPDLMQIQSAYDSLPSSIGSRSIGLESNLKKQIDSAAFQYRSLSHKCEDLENELIKIQKINQDYEANREDAVKWIEETTESLLRSIEQAKSLAQLLDKQNTVKNISSRMPDGQLKMDQTIESGKKLQVHLRLGLSMDRLRTQMDELNSDWKELNDQLNKTMNGLSDAIEKWSEYEQLYKHIRSWLEETEKEMNRVLQQSQNGGQAGGKTNKWVKDVLENIIKEVERYQPNFNKLHYLSDEICQKCPYSAVEQETWLLENNYQMLKDRLKMQFDSYSKYQQDLDEFKRKLDEAERWILQMSFQIMQEAEPQQQQQNHRGSSPTLAVNKSSSPSSPAKAAAAMATPPLSTTTLIGQYSTFSEVEKANQSHLELLRKIEAYRPNIDNVISLGNLVVEEHKSESEEIVTEVKSQMKGVEDRYTNLIKCAQQMKTHILSVMGKWNEYLDLLKAAEAFLQNEFPQWWNEFSMKSVAMPIRADIPGLSRDSLTSLNGRDSATDDQGDANTVLSPIEQARKMIARLIDLRRDLNLAAHKCNSGSNHDHSLDSKSAPSSSSSPSHRSNGKMVATIGKDAEIERINDNVHRLINEDISKLEKHLETLTNSKNDWQNFSRQREEFRNWLDEKVNLARKMLAKPEYQQSELANSNKMELENFLNEVKVKQPALSSLVDQYKRIANLKSIQDPDLKLIKDKYEGLVRDIDRRLNKHDKSMATQLASDKLRSTTATATMTSADTDLAASTQISRPHSSISTQTNPESSSQKTQTQKEMRNSGGNHGISKNFWPYNKSAVKEARHRELHGILDQIKTLRSSIGSYDNLSYPEPCSHSQPQIASPLSSSRIRLPGQESVRRNIDSIIIGTHTSPNNNLADYSTTYPSGAVPHPPALPMKQHFVRDFVRDYHPPAALHNLPRRHRKTSSSSSSSRRPLSNSGGHRRYYTPAEQDLSNKDVMKVASRIDESTRNLTETVKDLKLMSRKLKY